MIIIRHKQVLIMVVLFLAASMAYAQQDDINRFNSEGQKTGLWKKYYENGQIFYEGWFEEDKPVGIMKRYYPGGNLKAEMNFLDDGITSYAKLFYQNGKIAAEGKYIDNKRDSTWLFYSFYNDRLTIKEDYLNGEKHGFSVKYYDDGDTSEITSWKNGKKDGIWEQYYENDQIRLKASHSENLRDGSFETYSFEGAPSIKGTYKEGVMDGEWEYYDENGVLDFKVEYEDGRMLPNKEIIKRQNEFSRRIEEVLENEDNSEPELDEFR